ncbi:hypothetical protein [Vibrio cincinnatiensis]|uniref:hypothetical protein n=1 Tax=Vibrio cincinnatiensis TaxID=675 RepID=UPI001EDD4377|nr:hypothetical protein [Vibrio cincinnatiensis]MCG3733172.1 hypothetical protein [Vibrio cincinnatiensis]
MAGIYLHDVLLFFLLCIYLIFRQGGGRVRISSIDINLFVLFLIPFFFSACYSSIFNSELELTSFFFTFKVVWLVIVFSSIKLTFNVSFFSSKMFYFILFSISLPLVVSLVMYLLPEIEILLLSFYGEEKYPNALRYGGVFGRDVNTLGMYASLMLLVSMILTVNRYFFLGVFVFVISILSIALSGMRAGVLVIIFLLVASVFFSSIRVFSRARVALLLFFLTCFVLVAFSQLDHNLQVIILERFSLAKLFSDLTYGESGNLTHAAGYLDSVLVGHEEAWWTPITGYGTEIMFVDNLYIFLYLKYGVLSVLLFIFGMVFSFLIYKNSLIRFLILLSLLISLKGVFVLGNYYIYLCFFMVFINQYCSFNQNGLRVSK